MQYLTVKTVKAQVYVPHTAGRYQQKRFKKVTCPIVERLCNSLMMKGRNNGKKQMAVRIVKQAFEIMALLTNQNPVQVLVDAIANGGAREDSTRIGSGGVVRRQAVDVSPLRRVNQAIYLMTKGSRESSFRSLKSISECLADEIIQAAKVRICKVYSVAGTGFQLLCGQEKGGDRKSRQGQQMINFPNILPLSPSLFQLFIIVYQGQHLGVLGFWGFGEIGRAHV